MLAPMAWRSGIPGHSCLVSRYSAPALLRGKRRYAQAANTSNLSGGSSQAAKPGQSKGSWKPKQPLATAQTLTLFSETPQALLIALRSTLQSMTSLVSRLGPTPSSTSAESKSSSHDHVLLFALSKDLPSQYLGEAVALLQGSEPGKPSATSAAGNGASSASNIARVGVLSSPLPSCLIPANALEPGAPPLSSSTLYSVSLSLLPSVNAIPFRSTIPGKSDVAVGRWMDQKPSVREGTQRQSDLLDDETGAAATGGGRDWKEIWGRENLQGEVPEALAQLDPGAAASFLVLTDNSSQGLVEGLATRFPSSSVLGLVAPPTPFETGRDQTMLLSVPGAKDGIYTDGAVGVALVASADAKSDAKQESIAIPAVSTWFEGLQPFGARRKISAAQGNIISSLDNANAAQQFLRDIQSRTQPAQSSEDTGDMPESQARSIASSVKKEEDFYIAIFRSAAVKTEEPLLVARILSGHPSRGTLSIETHIDLGPGPGNEQGTMETYAQFYQTDPKYKRTSPTAGVEPLRPTAIEIPGPDPSAWVTPRFLFLSLPPSSDATAAQSVTDAPKPTSKKHQVMALPNLFVAGSERGWISGKGSQTALGQDTNPSNVLKLDGSTVVSCNVPLARVTLSLRGE